MKYSRTFRRVLAFISREFLTREYLLLALVLTLSIAGLTYVTLFADWVQRSLQQQATQLLAGDMIVLADQPYPDSIIHQAGSLGLALAESVSFPGLIPTGESTVRVRYKAVSSPYPLRSVVTVRDRYGVVHTGRFVPAPGTVWVDARLRTLLKARLGDKLVVGNSALLMMAEIIHEPDGSLDVYNFVPRVLLNRADLAGASLAQKGNEAQWRMMLAGSAERLARFKAWLAPRLSHTLRLEEVEDRRLEVRPALRYTRYFLGAVIILTGVLAAVAVVCVVRHYILHRWQSRVLSHDLGNASLPLIWLLLFLFALTAMLCGALGGLLGSVVTRIVCGSVASWETTVASLGLPPPWVMLLGPITAFVWLLCWALPMLWTSRVVSRPSSAPLSPGARGPMPLGLAALLLAAIMLVLLLWCYLGGTLLSVWWLAQLLGSALFIVGSACALVWVAQRLSLQQRSRLRLNLTEVSVFPGQTIRLMILLAIAYMGVFTLFNLCHDVLNLYQQRSLEKVPNTFVVNMPAGGNHHAQQQFYERFKQIPDLVPMVRGRLVLINGQPFLPSGVSQADHLREYEFSLSWTTKLPEGNTITAGRWWGDKKYHQQAQFSLEYELAKRLGVKLGDILTFAVAGATYEAKVSNFRTIAWDNFRANFQVLATPQVVDSQSASWLTSLRLTLPDSVGLAAALERSSTATVINVTNIVDLVHQIYSTMQRYANWIAWSALLPAVVLVWAGLILICRECLESVSVRPASAVFRGWQILKDDMGFFGLTISASILGALSALLLGRTSAYLLFDGIVTFKWATICVACAVSMGIAFLTWCGARFVRLA